MSGLDIYGSKPIIALVIDYHPDAQAEFDAILSSNNHGLKICLGIAIQRNVRIDCNVEPLTADEYLGPGKQRSKLYRVRHLFGVFSEVQYIFEKVGADVRVVAIGALQGDFWFALPTPGPIEQRAFARSV